NLPMGLQQMGQLNAVMAQQAMRASGVVVSRAIIGAGAPYAVAMGGLVAAAAGGLAAEASLAVASKSPSATAGAMELGNGLTGATLPRAAVGIGGAAVVARASTGTERALQTLGPELESALPSEATELSFLGRQLAQNYSRGNAFQTAVTEAFNLARNTTTML